MSSSSSTTATTTSSPSTADSLVSTPPPLQPLPSSSPPPPHVLTIHANFYVDEGQATSRFQQLLDMADVWVDPKTFMTAAGVEQRIKVCVYFSSSFFDCFECFR
jgi:hypothetical protein